MKTINSFIIERLKINKNTGLNTESDKVPSFVISIPKVEDDTVYMNEIWKKLELPQSKFIVFNDKYRGDKPHFADTEDFIMQLCCCQEDYEDFNPDKDILFSSNDLQETLEWIFDYLGIDYYPDEDSFEDWENEFDSNKYSHKILDNISILGRLYTGEDSYYKYTNEINYNKIYNKIYDILDNYFTIKK